MKKTFFFTMLYSLSAIGCCDCSIRPFSVRSPTLPVSTPVPIGYLKMGNPPKNIHRGDAVWIAIDHYGKIVGCDSVLKYPEDNYYVEHSGMFSQYTDTIKVKFERATIVSIP